MAPDDQRSRLLVTVTDERGRAVAAGLGRWLATAAPARARGSVNVALVSDARVRALNRQYRRKDQATDVLSFPAVDRSPSRPSKGTRGTNRVSAPSSVDPSLGEIVIARGVARRQARDAGHSERTEWRVLALHGLLHLLGYDHDADAGEMARVERRLRRRAGLRAGLIDRAAAARGAHTR
jgi:probable rRNA maturation factor